MAYEYDTKAVLLDWMKQGENARCFECDVPSPQWCSLSYGTYLCLTCSGTHRSLGVHLSFVRSLTMDKWTPAQIKRMQVGGNQPCREWFEQSAEYDKRMSIPDKYNTHAAAQYRDKLLAEAEGRDWSPADTPAPATSSLRNSSAEAGNGSGGALRKPRLGLHSGNSGSRGSSSASPVDQEGRSAGYNTPANASGASSQKLANESYFSKLGAANESRPDHLPPSQGGKYAGFGSQSSGGPGYSASGGGGSESLSSRALPSFEDIREDPVSAVSKGWGLFSAALGAVSKTVNESVIQPGLERAVDPNLQNQFSSYVSRAGSVIGQGARQGGQLLSSGLQTSSDLLKREAGLDVGDLGAGYLDKVTGRGAGGGYAQLGRHQAPSGQDDEGGRGGHWSSGPSSADHSPESFFDSQMGPSSSSSSSAGGRTLSPSLRSGASGYGTSTTARASANGLGRSASPLASSNLAAGTGPGISTNRTLSPPPSSSSAAAPPPAPVIPEGGWASLAPQSVARRAASPASSSTVSSKPAAVNPNSTNNNNNNNNNKAQAQTGKNGDDGDDDDWNDFGKDDQWD